RLRPSGHRRAQGLRNLGGNLVAAPGFGLGKFILFLREFTHGHENMSDQTPSGIASSRRSVIFSSTEAMHPKGSAIAGPSAIVLRSIPFSGRRVAKFRALPVILWRLGSST